MIHETAAAWVGRRDAGLDAAAGAEFRAWLAADPRHRAVFAEYDSTWAVLDRPLRGGVAEDVLDELQSLDRRQRRRRVLSGTVATAMLLAGISLWTSSGERRGSANQEFTATAKVLLPDHRTLSDGTLVELKEGAEIIPDFGAGHRRVALRRGDAYFQVAKDTTRPFVVEANGIEFRAVGTAFAVRLGSEAVEVIVTEGRVAVENTAIAAGLAGTSSVTVKQPPEMLLTAGEQAVIRPGSIGVKAQVIAQNELSERLAWRAPRLEFTGTPLSEVVALLNQYASAWQGGDRFLIEDSAIAQVRVSGLFRADKTEVLLDLLDSGFGIKAERRGASEIVLRRASMPR
ncbi:MAG: hypothetical protein A3G75_03855 [Verrucomicrobia bacterium RIFCSPLOWO2_12_FULL_64_8]|nr:MAG: hypothetical protein A3G75_03855 [Verrucomicrobia bacterium RIFCSPLOWO2_12_FULL_64_8]